MIPPVPAIATTDEPPHPALPATDALLPGGITIVHEDSALVVVDKPSGMLCVPGRGPDKADCLASRVQAVYSDALVVHRLDMATSGLVVFARGQTAQSRLSVFFRDRQIGKRYLAVVAGRVPANDGEIDLPIGTDWPNRPRRRIDRETGKPSLTRYRVLGSDARAAQSRLELEPVTGRTHQLRLHLQAIGHPIVGDLLYADGPVATAAPRLLLHATRLELAHPLTGEALALTSPAPF